MFAKLKKLFTKKDSKKETKKDTNEESLENKKWNKLWQLYSDGEWDDPIFYLCDYDSGINGEGHQDFFANHRDCLDKYNEELKKMLPEDLYLNFFGALQAFRQEEIESDIYEEADDYFFSHEAEIEQILQEYANTLEI